MQLNPFKLESKISSALHGGNSRGNKSGAIYSGGSKTCSNSPFPFVDCRRMEFGPVEGVGGWWGGMDGTDMVNEDITLNHPRIHHQHHHHHQGHHHHRRHRHHPSINLSVHSFTNHAPILHPLFHPSVHLFIHSIIPSFIHSFIHSPIHPFIHALRP